MDVFESVRIHFPRYLSSEESRELFSELKRFPDMKSYFSSLCYDDPLQGDGWTGFVVRRSSDGEARSVKGIVLSNTCDLASENARNGRVRVVFSPLASLERYLNLLREAGKTEEQITSIRNDIRGQRVTSIFYLPMNAALGEETIAVLDDVHSEPIAQFFERSPEHLFSLSQAGFYVFLLKLSIHFTRLMEGISRVDQRIAGDCR